MEVYLENEPTRVNAEVIESNEVMILLGMDWMKKVRANINVEDKIINIKGRNGYVEIPVEITEENEYDDDEESDESDYEEE
jgi:hypothetical protein